MKGMAEERGMPPLRGLQSMHEHRKPRVGRGKELYSNGVEPLKDSGPPPPRAQGKENMNPESLYANQPSFFQSSRRPKSPRTYWKHPHQCVAAGTFIFQQLDNGWVALHTQGTPQGELASAIVERCCGEGWPLCKKLNDMHQVILAQR